MIGCEQIRYRIVEIDVNNKFIETGPWSQWSFQLIFSSQRQNIKCLDVETWLAWPWFGSFPLNGLSGSENSKYDEKK